MNQMLQATFTDQAIAKALSAVSYMVAHPPTLTRGRRYWNRQSAGPIPTLPGTSLANALGSTPANAAG